MTSAPDNTEKLNALYHLEATTIYAARADQRFSYTLYVPTGLTEEQRKHTTILAAVHGTGRMQTLYRDIFSEFARAQNCIVLAPLFPANVLQDGNLSGYKYIQEGDIRYDHIMLDMIDEVAQRYHVSGGKVLMFGFSGGAHFTHRFTLLHPHRIRAASVGAPGSVTLLDFERPWWTGVADVQTRFGVTIDRSAFRGLPIHFVVGKDDTENWEITFHEGDRHYMQGANDAGATRPERIRTLAASFAKAGASTRIDEVPGASHEVTDVVAYSQVFFADVLNGRA